MSNSPFLEKVELLRRASFRATGEAIATKDAPTAFSATAGMLSIHNAATAATNVIIPRHIVLKATTANTSATDFKIHGYLDDINRYSSGGSELSEVNSYHTSDSNYTDVASVATTYFGDLTLAAANDAKRLFKRQLSEDVLAAEEQLEIFFYFPDEFMALQNLANNQVAIPAFGIGYGCTFTMHEEAESQSADPAFDVELHYIDYNRDA
jgi:hypothetical protein